MSKISCVSWLGVGLAGALLFGCGVPQERYDEAVARLQQERAAARAAEEHLSTLRERLKNAEALTAKQNQELHARENELMRSQLDIEREATARNDATVMVDQLRGELARAGDHLRFFADQKKELESALDGARERAAEVARAERQFEVRAGVIRDVSFALRDAVTKNQAVFTVDRTNTVIRLPASTVFAGEHPDVQRNGRTLLERIARAVSPYESARIEVILNPASSDYRPENIVVQLQRVADVFNSVGVPYRRVTLTMPPEKTTDEPSDARTPKAAAARAAEWQAGPGSLELSFQVGTTEPTAHRQ